MSWHASITQINPGVTAYIQIIPLLPRIVKYYALLTSLWISSVDRGVQDLDIAEGLKQLLMDAGFTVDFIISLGYREVSEMLQIEPYVGKLIVDAERNITQEKSSSPDTSNE